jgi:hypothetical protein
MIKNTGVLEGASMLRHVAAADIVVNCNVLVYKTKQHVGVATTVS